MMQRHLRALTLTLIAFITLVQPKAQAQQVAETEQLQALGYVALTPRERRRFEEAVRTVEAAQAEQRAARQARIAEQRAARQARIAEQRAARQARIAEQRAARQARIAEQRAARQARIAEQRAARQATQRASSN